jgi:broad specificity phosphatase PhoE
MEKYTRLYLARHGQIKGFERMTANGHTDIDITETGVIQMQTLAERLRLVELHAIYATGLIRTKRAKDNRSIPSVADQTKPDLRRFFR